MTIKMMSGKIHGARVTGCDVYYEGSIVIDEDLMKMANIMEYESVEIWDRTNGSRLQTYTIKGKAGSGIIMLNGAAARKVSIGDHVIIAAFREYTEAEATAHKPSIVLIDNDANKGKIKPV